MKKNILAVCVVAMMVFVMALPAWSDTLIIPVSGATYTNPTMLLPNSNPDSEQAFLADILGLPTTDPSLQFIGKLFDNYGASSINEQIPFPWTYAVVKSDGPNDGWYGFQSDGDGYLTAGPFAQNKAGEYYNISHASFFGGTPQVPEPATLFLLGFGLVGIAGISRKLKK